MAACPTGCHYTFFCVRIRQVTKPFWLHFSLENLQAGCAIRDAWDGAIVLMAQLPEKARVKCAGMA
jgi:hypothetical protein